MQDHFVVAPHLWNQLLEFLKTASSLYGFQRFKNMLFHLDFVKGGGTLFTLSLFLFHGFCIIAVLIFLYCFVLVSNCLIMFLFVVCFYCILPWAYEGRYINLLNKC